MIINIKGSVKISGVVIIKDEDKPGEVALAAESPTVTSDTLAFEDGVQIYFEQDN